MVFVVVVVVEVVAVRGSFAEKLRVTDFHILNSPKIIVSLACALRDHKVTFSLAQRSLCPVGMCLKRS